MEPKVSEGHLVLSCFDGSTATGKKKNALKRSVLFYFIFQGKCKHDRSSKT